MSSYKKLLPVFGIPFLIAIVLVAFSFYEMYAQKDSAFHHEYPTLNKAKNNVSEDLYVPMMPDGYKVEKVTYDYDTKSSPKTRIYFKKGDKTIISMHSGTPLYEDAEKKDVNGMPVVHEDDHYILIAEENYLITQDKSDLPWLAEMVKKGFLTY